MSPLVHLFGYGSLIATPERSDTVVDTTLGCLQGYGRVFNKRSPSRGCPTRDGFDAFKTDVPENFLMGGRNHSLAVGTLSDPNEKLYGALVSYRAEIEEQMLSVTDQREGYDASADRATLGYLRINAKVIRPKLNDTVDAWVYLSNPAGAYHLPEHTPMSIRAKILIRATPQPNTLTARSGRALGLNYLEQIRTGLAQWNVVDRALEQVAHAVHSLPGPWVKLVAPPAL